MWKPLHWCVVAVVIASANCVSISLPECGPKFYCPDNCNISYVNNCPHNCNCKPIKFCPEVKCPAKAPGCIIVTKEDGCQTCVCHQPVILIKDTSLGSEDTEFLFFDKKDFEQAQIIKNVSLNATTSDLCTLDDVDQVDQCVLKTLNYKKFVKRRKDDAVATINPLVQIHQNDLERLCSLYSDGLSCLGRDLYQRCRLVHFDLAQIDAFLGFPCGPKQTKFFQHYPCIQDTHKRSTRLQHCEELVTASLLQLSQSSASLEEKQKRKCAAMKWFIGCERPNVYRHCSNEAADVYTKSLMSAAEYITPDCNAEFGHEVFAPKMEPTIDIEIASIDSNIALNETFDGNSTVSNETLTDSDPFFGVNATSDDLELFNSTLNETEKRLYTRPPWLRKTIENELKIKAQSEKFSSSSDVFHRILLLPRKNLQRDSPIEQENLEVNKKPEQKVIKDEIFRSLAFNPNPVNETDLEYQTINSSSLLLVSGNAIDNESLSFGNESESAGEPDLNIIPISSTIKPWVHHRWFYANDTLILKENLTCKVEYQKIIDSKYKNLLSEIRDKTRTASLSFPLAYSFSKQNLKAKCSAYQNATADIPGKVKKACASNYEVYDQVTNVYAYPCGWGSETYFFYYFDCISEARNVELVKECEFNTNEYLKDPSLDQCQAYGLLTDCIYDTVVRRCGYDAWEVAFQFLSTSVKNYVQDCTVPRLYRAVS